MGSGCGDYCEVRLRTEPRHTITCPPPIVPDSPAQVDVLPATSPTKLFCNFHSAPHRRPKIDAHDCECRRCRRRLRTTYAEFAVCAECSYREGICILCGLASMYHDRRSASPVGMTRRARSMEDATDLDPDGGPARRSRSMPSSART